MGPVRLGRTLDALAERIDAIQGAILARVVTELGVRLDQLHVDATSFMLEGACPSCDPELPAMARGYSPGNDKRRKQVRTGVVVTPDGNVPLYHQVFDGNRTDSRALMETHRSLRVQMKAHGVEPPEIFPVGGSKLLAAGSLDKLLVEGVLFVGPMERRAELEQELLALDPGAWQELPYASEAELLRRGGRNPLPEEEWNRFWSQEREWVVTDSNGKEHRLRKVFIRSAEEQRAALQSRKRPMQSAEKDLQKVANGIPRCCKTVEHVQKKVHTILTKRRVTELCKVEIGAEQGRPLLRWGRDQEAVERLERLQGHYVLLTNTAPEKKSANDLLATQKGQYRVEHRFANWKGPLKVRPFFLKSNRRVAAPALLCGLALVVFSLLEREVRRRLGDEDGFARGFLPENRLSRPTGAKILEALGIVKVTVDPGEHRISRVWNVRGAAAQVYRLFDVTPQSLMSGGPDPVES